MKSLKWTRRRRKSRQRRARRLIYRFEQVARSGKWECIANEYFRAWTRVMNATAMNVSTIQELGRAMESGVISAHP